MSSEISNTEQQVRSKILNTASELFYSQGIRAVGVDLVVERAGVAKSSLYRHFNTKDELIVAFLKLKDEQYWRNWEQIANDNKENPRAELQAQITSIAEQSCRTGFRGCPHLNAVTEFPDVDHPAHKFASAHKLELRCRLKYIAERLCKKNADELAIQLALLIDGACVTTTHDAIDVARLLTKAADILIRAHMAGDLAEPRHQ